MYFRQSAGAQNRDSGLPRSTQRGVSQALVCFNCAPRTSAPLRPPKLYCHFEEPPVAGPRNLLLSLLHLCQHFSIHRRAPHPLRPPRRAFFFSPLVHPENSLVANSKGRSPISPNSSARHKELAHSFRAGVLHLCRIRTKGPVLSRGYFHYISTHSTLSPHTSRKRSKEATTCKEVLFVS